MPSLVCCAHVYARDHVCKRAHHRGLFGPCRLSGSVKPQTTTADIMQSIVICCKAHLPNPQHKHVRASCELMPRVAACSCLQAGHTSWCALTPQPATDQPVACCSKIGTMVKIGSKDLGIDDACNLYVGAGAVVNGLIWIFKPSKVHVRPSSYIA